MMGRGNEEIKLVWSHYYLVFIVIILGFGWEGSPFRQVRPLSLSLSFFRLSYTHVFFRILSNMTLKTHLSK